MLAELTRTPLPPATPSHIRQLNAAAAPQPKPNTARSSLTVSEYSAPIIQTPARHGASLNCWPTRPMTKLVDDLGDYGCAYEGLVA